jgi:hypothetical protein
MALGLSTVWAAEATAPQLKEYSGATTCIRCSGLMVTEPCFELIVWRCVQCGERVDPVILQNRQQRLARGTVSGTTFRLLRQS